MRVRKVGKRGFVVSFENDYIGDTTNVYVINTEETIFVCDTFLGSNSMEKVVNYEELKDEFKKKKIIVFNSHFDWDHIWGNNYFKDDMIISHEKCKENMIEYGEEGLEKHGEQKEGEVELVFPKITFSDKLVFEKEGVEFFHTPGHTSGSSSCYDKIDQVLFVGDNLEKPIPYLNVAPIDDYLVSLKKYAIIQVKEFIPGHGEIATSELLDKNLAYLEEVKTLNFNLSSFSERKKKIHISNMQTMGSFLVKEGKKEEGMIYFKKALKALKEIYDLSAEDMKEKLLNVILAHEKEISDLK
ncbi:MAG: MBL fold metallo-hydrolase [Candidatus Kariarchaeaceae archaeon]